MLEPEQHAVGRWNTRSLKIWDGFPWSSSVQAAPTLRHCVGQFQGAWRDVPRNKTARGLSAPRENDVTVQRNLCSASPTRSPRSTRATHIHRHQAPTALPSTWRQPARAANVGRTTALHHCRWPELFSDAHTSVSSRAPINSDERSQQLSATRVFRSAAAVNCRPSTVARPSAP